MGIEQINSINEKILGLSPSSSKPSSDISSDKNGSDDTMSEAGPAIPGQATTEVVPTNKGRLITDATACTQDIAYPTDLNLLNDAREKSEELIDKLYDAELHGVKPRTYREVARKNYLKTAQLKIKSKKQIHKAVKQQLGYLKRNIKNVNRLLDQYDEFPLKWKDHRYLLVITTLYEQQYQMFREGSHKIEHRIVSIHQPHVRPIVRWKTNAYVEFGAKINVSIMNVVCLPG